MDNLLTTPVTGKGQNMQEDFLDLIKRTRSTRRFKQDVRIENNVLMKLVSVASYCPSAMNKQPMKYIISNSDEMNRKIFENLIWAPYITDWAGPEPGQRPAAYLIMVLDTDIAEKAEIDSGIQAQSILLCAQSMGISGCMLEKINKQELSKVLELPERYKIQLVIALGVRDEEIVIDPVKDESDGGHGIKFYHDEAGRHHVPKRKAEELVLTIR
ncbi:MAG: nitroreductase family protein [Catonella sp.]|nr:nitroreductase family protein [Catonella sp.]MDY6355795.1 nitroreductase family protein [Catonella sp.]